MLPESEAGSACAHAPRGSRARQPVYAQQAVSGCRRKNRPTSRVRINALRLVLGQLLALGAILIAMGFWRRTASFGRHAYLANVILMILGFILTGYQLVGFFVM